MLQRRSVWAKLASAPAQAIAVAGGVQSIAALAKAPFAAVVGLAQGKVIGGNIGLAFRKAFFGHGELVHEGKAEVMFFGGEVDLDETAAEMFGGFPADLAAQAGLIAGGLDAGQALQEIEQDRFEKMPILCAAGKQAAQPEFVAARLINVDRGEIALARGGDVETEPRFFDFRVLIF